MKRALALARRGLGATSPNPAVGCVIVQEGRVVGEGWHRKAGTPHAEVHALRQAGEQARGADVYVTLEPCSHHGRTPPCAEALVAAGVGKVFVGMKDPNPLVAGKGLEILRAAGIAVETGILESECLQLTEAFRKHITTRMPFVTCKCAMTLDGRIATASGDSKWITSEVSRRYVHRLRSLSDAVMVGAETALIDDPLLDTRMLGRRRDPLRVIVDSRLRLPLTAKVLAPEMRERTILATALPPDHPRHAEYAKAGVRLISTGGERVDVEALLRRLGEDGVQSVLLEGGGVLAGEFLRRRLIDRFFLFYAFRILGGEGRAPFAGRVPSAMTEAVPLKKAAVRRIGGDLLVTGYPEYACSQD